MRKCVRFPACATWTRPFDNNVLHWCYWSFNYIYVSLLLIIHCHCYQAERISELKLAWATSAEVDSKVYVREHKPLESMVQPPSHYELYHAYVSHGSVLGTLLFIVHIAKCGVRSATLWWDINSVCRRYRPVRGAMDIDLLWVNKMLILCLSE